MPYYDRAERLGASINALERWYSAEDMDIIIVDDGSPEPLQFDSILDVTILRIDRNPKPRNPCVPINMAVKHAKGDDIIITSPEIEHHRSVFPKLFYLHRNGRDVVSAMCFDNERGWLAGPRSPRGGKRAPMPEGSDFPFCMLLTRDFFYAAGGYDEDYRNGQGYDDNDFLWRLERAGAIFKCSRHEVHHHHKAVEWKMKSNEPLFRSKWPDLFA